jgi:hypothetical protein
MTDRYEFKPLSRCQRLKFCFRAKQITPGFLEFFSLQNKTKMKKIGDYDLFFDFFIFSSKRWLGTKKKITIPKVVAIFKRENFLNIRTNRNSLAIKGAEKKCRLLTELTFFCASLWKKANY